MQAMRAPASFILLLILAASAVVAAFVLPRRPAPAVHHDLNRNTHALLQHAGVRQRQQRQQLLQHQKLWARGGPEDDDSELQRLMDRLLNGGDERVDLEAWERRRRLEIQREEEEGLMGKVKAFGRKLSANFPVLFFAPLVLLAAAQLSSIAITTAIVAALVVASFSLPVIALAFVVPIAIFLLLGTLAFPIVPFAVFTLAPSLVVAPLFFFLGWLLLQMVSSPTVVREDSLFNSFGGFPFDEWVRLDDEAEAGRAPGRRREDGVIDVKAEEDTDPDEEEALRRFDERLRGDDDRRRW